MLFLFLVLGHVGSTSFARLWIGARIRIPYGPRPDSSCARTLVFGPVQSTQGYSGVWPCHTHLVGLELCDSGDCVRLRDGELRIKYCFSPRFFQFLIKQSLN